MRILKDLEVNIILATSISCGAKIVRFGGVRLVCGWRKSGGKPPHSIIVPFENVRAKKDSVKDESDKSEPKCDGWHSSSGQLPPRS